MFFKGNKKEVFDDKELIKFLNKNAVSYKQDAEEMFVIKDQLSVRGYNSVRLEKVIRFEGSLFFHDAKDVSILNTTHMKYFEAPIAANIDISDVKSSGSLDFSSARFLKAGNLFRAAIVTAPMLEDADLHSLKYIEMANVPSSILQNTPYAKKARMLDDKEFKTVLNEMGISYGYTNNMMVVKDSIDINGYKEVVLKEVIAFESMVSISDAENIVLSETVTMGAFDAPHAKEVLTGKLKKSEGLNFPKVKIFDGRSLVTAKNIIMPMLDEAILNSLTHANKMDFSGASFVCCPELIECKNEILLNSKFVKENRLGVVFADLIGNRSKGFDESAQMVIIDRMRSGTLAQIRDEVCRNDAQINEYQDYRTRAELAQGMESFVLKI